MTLSILSKYKIRFFQGKFGRSVESPHHIMNQFVSDLRSIVEVQDTINALEAALGEGLELDFSSETLITVHVNKEESRFYDTPECDNKKPSVFSLPTSDFKEIVEAWKEYLENQ